MLKSSFHFLREEQDKVFVECYGIDFEDFEVGQIFEHRPGRTFTLDEAVRYGVRSLDLSPQYADQEYAKKINDGRVRVPEAHVMAAFAVSTRTFGKVVANLSMTGCEVGEVYVGDTLYFESEVLGKRKSRSRPDQGLMHVATRAKNQQGVQVFCLERQFLVYLRGHGPYQAAGY